MEKSFRLGVACIRREHSACARWQSYRPPSETAKARSLVDETRRRGDDLCHDSYVQVNLQEKVNSPFLICRIFKILESLFSMSKLQVFLKGYIAPRRLWTRKWWTIELMNFYATFDSFTDFTCYLFVDSSTWASLSLSPLLSRIMKPLENCTASVTPRCSCELDSGQLRMSAPI